VALPTVTDLKAHLNVPAAVTDDDAELGEVLDAAIEIVADIVGPLEASPVTEIHSRVSSGVLVLRGMPAADLTAISFRAGLTSTPLTLSDYELDATSGIVRVVSGSGFYGDYVVEYTAGFDTLPASIRLAVLIIAAHLFETQRMPMQGESFAPTGFGPAAGEVVAPAGRGYALPNRALELLRPYSFTSLS
jgi:uncharacterized phiE125 gp8 family phage protein